MPVVARVAELAQRRGVPMADIALAWHWARGVTAPIVGCSRPDRVDDAVRALDLSLSAEEVGFLEDPYRPHELVGPLARPGERPLAGTTDPTMNMGRLDDGAIETLHGLKGSYDITIRKA